MRLKIVIVVDNNQPHLLNNMRLAYVFWKLRINVTELTIVCQIIWT